MCILTVNHQTHQLKIGDLLFICDKFKVGDLLYPY